MGLKRLYRIFSIITILVLPLAFYSFFTAFAVEQGKYNEYFYFGKFKELPEIGSIATRLLKVLGYLVLTSNIVSCIILVLVLCQIQSILRSVNNGTQVADAQLNQTVTLSHICLILTYTVASFFCFNIHYSTKDVQHLQ